MTLISCPECEREVSDQALMCPHCGYGFGGMFNYEYRSEATLFGLPLVHIVRGRQFDPATGKRRVAKGIIAIGPIAMGGLAMGGLSVGVVALGGVSLGIVALGGLAVGLGLAVGGGAIGFIAFGGGAIGYYAIGGGAFGVHAWGGNAQDPNVPEFLRNWIGAGRGGS